MQTADQEILLQEEMVLQTAPRKRWEKNTRKLVIISGARHMLFIMPIMAVYYTQAGLSFTQISLLQSIFSISVFLFEIPTGYIGDLYGRKRSIIRGTIFAIAGYTVYGLSHSFWGFALAEIVLALGIAFVSGSDNALLYDTLWKNKKAENTKKRAGKITFGGEVATIVSSIIGGMYAAHYAAGNLFLMTAIVVALSLPFVFGLEEVQIDDDSKEDTEKRSFLVDSKKIISFFHKSPQLMWVVVYTGLLGYSTYSLVWSQQLWLTQLHAPIARFGVFWTMYRVGVATTGLGVERYDKKLGDAKALGGLLVIASLGFLIIIFSRHRAIAFLGIFIAFSVRGLQGPLSTYYLNHHINNSSLRATMLSFSSMIHRLFYAILLPIQGYIADTRGYRTMFIVFFIFLLITGITSRVNIFRAEKG